MICKNHFVDKAKELYKIQQQLKVLKMQEDTLKEDLKTLTNNEGARMGGFQFLPEARKGLIDYKAIVAIELPNDFDFEPYRKEESKAWKLALYVEEE